MVGVVGKRSDTHDKNKTDIGFIHYFTNGYLLLIRESCSLTVCMAYLSQWMHLPNLDLVGEVHVLQSRNGSIEEY